MSAEQDLYANGTAQVSVDAGAPISPTLLWLLAGGVTGLMGVGAVRALRRRARPGLDPRAGTAQG